MPSVTPKGALISQIRRSQGFTQLELALRAGVSERTVRNAERGQAIKHDFLKFIASGLGVSLPEVVHSVDHLQLREHWQLNVDRLLSGFGALLIEHDPSRLLSFVDREVAIRREGGFPEMAFGYHLFGEFRGAAEAEGLLDDCCQFWQTCGDVDHYVETPVGAGDVVVLRYGHEVPLRNGSLGWVRSVVVCEFSGESLVRLEEHVVPGDGTPEQGLLAHCTKITAQGDRLRRPWAG